MQITLNGEPRSMPADATVAGLIHELGIDPVHVAIERNLTIVPRSRYGEEALAEGDAIEIVEFIGGG